MLQNFVPSTPPSPVPSTPTPQPQPPEPTRDPVRILIIGTPRGIDAIRHSLHVKGFARIEEWSRLLPHDSGRQCRILTRHVPLS